MPDRQPGDPEHLMLVTDEERKLLGIIRDHQAAYPVVVEVHMDLLSMTIGEIPAGTTFNDLIPVKTPFPKKES